MDPSLVAGLSDAQILGLTGAAEARAYLDPDHGWRPAPLVNMIAVMWTPVHRVASDPQRFGETVTDACLAPAQYSCWTDGSGSNHDWLLAQVQGLKAKTYVAPIVQQCIAAATQILAGQSHDLVNGATHYYAPVSMVPAGRIPTWAVGQTPVATVGDHLFFKGV